jgi:LysM repeat protein
MSACSPFESIIVEPERSDLQLTVDTLKTSLRDAQRTVAELRAEIDTRRQELADAQIARAQLEGRIREAERRLTESRRVIDLQREELAAARSEREQVERTRASLQLRLKRLQQQISNAGADAKGHVSASAMVSPRDGQRGSTDIGFQPDVRSIVQEEGIGVFQGMAIQGTATSSAGDVSAVAQSASESPPAHVLIRPGDTLWRLARRYQTSVRRLMALNALPSDRIQAGQTLRLLEPSLDEPEDEPM